MDCKQSTPRAENNIADHLSKCAAQKLPVEPGTFVLHLTQPSVSPATMAQKTRKLEERFDGLQIEHVPRAENNIADHLSKCGAQKLPVEPGTFVLHPSQPSVSPATMARKRRKLDSSKPLPVQPLEAPGRELGGINSPSVTELPPPTRPPVPAIEECTPTKVEVPLVLIAEPPASTWRGT